MAPVVRSTVYRLLRVPPVPSVAYAMVPACAVFAQSRVLFISGLGGLALVAEMLHAYRTRDRLVHDGRKFRPGLALFAPLGIWVHLIIAPLVGLSLSEAALCRFELRFRRLEREPVVRGVEAGERHAGGDPIANIDEALHDLPRHSEPEIAFVTRLDGPGI